MVGTVEELDKDKTHEGETYKKNLEHKERKTEMSRMTQIDEALISKLKELPADYWDFRENDTKEYSHGFHNYPAMMVCPISRNIIRLVKEIQPVNALLDPFAGSGTVLVEGMLNGIGTVAGNDINPLALLLIKVKTTPIQHSPLLKEVKDLLNRITTRRDTLIESLNSVDSYVTETLGLDIAGKKGWGDDAPTYLQQFCYERNLDINIPDFKNLGYWFRPRVVLELSIIKSEIEEIGDEDIRDFIFVAMSESIRVVSNRRNGEFKMFRMPIAKVQKFNPDVYGEFTKILYRNIDKMQDFCEALEEANSHSNISVFRNNTCTLEDVPNDAYDLVVTSPPYGDSRTTVAYGEYSRLSLQWINLFDLTEREIMGVDRSLMGGKKYRNGFEFTLESNTLRESLEKIKDIDVERAGDVYSFYADLDAAIKSVALKTKSGGYQFWVVGNRTVKNELLKTDVIINELALQYGLTPIYTIERNIPNKVMPSQNSPTNVTGVTGSTMTMEHIVVLRKN